ncbi:MAG TPA: cobalamin-independent methionine synthase II family protein [Chloroflexota bacterium]
MISERVQRRLALLRVDHTGGFRKPDRLQEVYARFARSQASLDEVRRIQDESVRALIAQEEAHRLPVLSDGEYRRRQFQESFGEAVTGFKDALPGATYLGGPALLAPTRRVESGPSGPGPAVLHRLPAARRLELVHNVPLEEYQLAAPLSQRPVKVALVGPDRVSQRFEWESSSDVYSGLDDFVDDVVRIQRRMVSELVDAGCEYIQLDEPGYTAYVDEALLAKMRNRGEDPARNLERSIAADNAVMAGFEGVTFGIHICRGGGSSGYHRDGRYEAIAERLFSQLRCQRLLLEYDTERSGGYEPLRFVPRGTVAVLGLISTRIPEVESVDELQRRIEQASRYLPVEQLALSPRCGLGLPEDSIWRKVSVMLETAERVWG